MPANFIHHPSSYRDPSGFIFEQDGILYRQVNKVFKEQFDFFITSGCYDKLVKEELLIPHEEIIENLTGDDYYYKTLRPATIPFISYPYEWSFDMLKDAALLTLNILKKSIACGVILKDATPYNLQWHDGKFIFIDSLSFEKYDETKPWIAYRQFCENFLAPLVLTHYSGKPLQEMLLAYSDGIPLPVVASLLPRRSKFSVYTYLHIHLHAKYSEKPPEQTQKKNNFSRQKLLNLVSSLELLVKKLKLPAGKTAWSAYYDEASQRKDYLQNKMQVIQQWLKKINPVTVADFGANKGEFSKLAATENIATIATDFDAICINTLYKEIKSGAVKNILPLIIDLAKPSPAIGVNNEERNSFINRTHVDMGFALALIHHLAIGKNIPFEKIATLFQKMCTYLLIEFVPKDDEKVQFMLQQKEDIYQDYNEASFTASFLQYFSIEDKQPVAGSGRTLYLLRNNER